MASDKATGAAMAWYGFPTGTRVIDELAKGKAAELADLLDRFAADAVREEREACKECASRVREGVKTWRSVDTIDSSAFRSGFKNGAAAVFDAIRARTESEAE